MPTRPWVFSEKELEIIKRAAQTADEVRRGVWVPPADARRVANPPVLTPADTHAQDMANAGVTLRALIADYGASVVWQEAVMAVYGEYKDVVERLTGWRPPIQE